MLKTSETTTVATPTPAMGLLQDGEDEEKRDGAGRQEGSGVAVAAG